MGLFLLSHHKFFVILSSLNLRIIKRIVKFIHLPKRFYFLANCLLSLLLMSEFTSAQEVNPLATDPRAARAGGSIFRAQCATCHGADAKGIETIETPDLTLMFTRSESTDASVFQVIREGVPGSIMPPHTFPDTEVWMLVSYLRSVAIAGTSAQIDGDPARGTTLFNLNCLRCHRVDNRGGSLGPNLSTITNRRSQDALTNSIRNPSAEIARRYKPVTLVTADNGRIRGTVKSEDAFSIQIMDSDQVLRGFRKSSLQEVIHEDISLMPSFPESALSGDDINDVLRFLQSAR
jgi:putative heme-binding domain-containing protein